MPKTRNPKKGQKKVEPKLWIYCEGKTEYLYLNGYIQERYSGNRLIENVKLKSVKQHIPESLIKRVLKDKKRQERTALDLYWVAYDREAKEKYSDELHSQAMKKAKDNDIEVALSCVCFEQWLLLHFHYSTATYTSCQNLMAHSELKASLQKLGIVYNKVNDDLYIKLKDRIGKARRNAEKLKESMVNLPKYGAQAYEKNPYTDFHLLLDAIDKFAEK